MALSMLLIQFGISGRTPVVVTPSEMACFETLLEVTAISRRTTNATFPFLRAASTIPRIFPKCLLVVPLNAFSPLRFVWCVCVYKPLQDILKQRWGARGNFCMSSVRNQPASPSIRLEYNSAWFSSMCYSVNSFSSGPPSATLLWKMLILSGKSPDFPELFPHLWRMNRSGACLLPSSASSSVVNGSILQYSERLFATCNQFTFIFFTEPLGYRALRKFRLH